MKPIWNLDQIVAQLTNWGARWNNDLPVPFMFYAQSMAHHQFKTGFGAVSEAERQSLLGSMQLISDVSNIGFVNIPSTAQQPSTSNPFMGFYTFSQASSPIWGATTAWVSEGGTPNPSGRIYGVDVVVNRYHANNPDFGGWELGNWNSRTLLHETLHGLGLDHAGKYNQGATSYEVNAAYYQDSQQYTVMSYWAAFETGASHMVGGVVQFASTPLLYDVAALQKLYGANMSTRAGNTVYGFNNTSGRDAFDLQRDPSAVFTIWDAGGVDTLDLSGYSSASRVDLREGGFSDAGGMTSNISIAYGARIEDAIGGSGNDSLTGNESGNRLVGGGGDDRMSGGMGDDMLVGGDGSDTAEYSGARSDYRVLYLGGGQVRVTGTEGTDLLTGVERLQFADGIFHAPQDHFGNMSFALQAFGAGGAGWTSNDAYPRTLADINGDGLADIVGFGNGGVFASLAAGDGTFGSMYLALEAFGAQSGGWTSDNIFHRELADINGDGLADVVGFGNAGVYASLATGAGTFGSMQFALANFGANAGGWSDDDTYPRMLADINGDGLADIVGFGNGGVYASLATGNGTFGDMYFALEAFGPQAGGWTSDNLFHRELADINGDGLADLVGFGNAGVYAALATGGGKFGSMYFALEAFGAGAAGWTSNDAFPRMLADINGDGLADLIGFGNAGVYTALATGGGKFGDMYFAMDAFAPEAGGWTSDDLFHRELADVDGDGWADIVGFGNDGVHLALAGQLMPIGA